MEYYPYDAPIFKGFSIGKLRDQETGELMVPEEQFSGLLSDIENFCKGEPSQNAQVRCGGEVFPACRFLMAARSKRFRTILGLDAGKSTAAVTIKDVEPEVMRQLINFVHNDRCEWLDDSLSSVKDLKSLFQAADSYEIPSLLNKTGSVLSARLSTENVLDIWEVADNSSWETLKEECIKYMDSIPGSQVAHMMRGVSSPGVTPRVLA